MMPRYLTPLKISLLVLTDLYVFEHIPSTARLNVLDFIATQITPLSDQSPGGNSLETHFESSTADITGALSQSLSKWPSNIPGRSIYDILLLRLWDLHGLDSLHEYFQHIASLIAPASPRPENGTGAEGRLAEKKLSRTSPLGQFIRRCCVEFTRLQFADAEGLWTTFAAWRVTSYDIWAQRNPEAARQRKADQVAATWARTIPLDETDSTSAVSYTSAEDTSALLSFSIHRLQKLGHRMPNQLKSSLQSWLTHPSSSTVSSVAQDSLQHFLSFFDHWRAGQYTAALESLHRYFDYSLISAGKGGGDGGGNGNGNGGSVKAYYQYALLHLSVLHADFERWEESVDAMEECIATARENQDTSCLNFALSWLLYLQQAQPSNTPTSFRNLACLIGSENGDGERTEIAFLKAKARESKSWGLMSTALLEEAKGEMMDGGSSTKSHEHLLQAAYLNIQHDLRTLIPSTLLFQAAGLDRLGQAAFSTVTYESIVLIHSMHCPLSDRVRATCRVAYGFAHQGRYHQAIELLDRIAAGEKGEGEGLRGVLKLEQRVRAFKGMVLLKRSLNRDDLDAAAYYFEHLRPLRSFADPEIGFEIDLLELELLIKQQDFPTALQKVNAHIAALKNNKSADIAHLIHLLVQKSSIFAAASQPLKGFSIALRAAAAAERHLLVGVLLEALAVLANILLGLGEFKAVRDLVGAALVSALEGGDMNVTAVLFSHLAEAHVGVAGQEDCADDAHKCMRSINTAERYIERSYEAYEKLSHLSGMLQCLTMKARLARWKGDERSAGQADEIFDQLLRDKDQRD